MKLYLVILTKAIFDTLNAQSVGQSEPQKLMVKHILKPLYQLNKSTQKYFSASSFACNQIENISTTL